MSQKRKDNALPLPGDYSRSSYCVGLKLRDLNTQKPDPRKGFRNGIALVLPVADSMVALDIDGIYNREFATRLFQVQGELKLKKGAQIKDCELHEVEISVHLEGVNVRIEALLDEQPLFAWNGSVAALSLDGPMAEIPKGAIGLCARIPNYVVTEVKVKKL